MTAVRAGPLLRPTVAEIDLEAVRHNVRALKPPDAELMAVVKADGYGHGAVPVARAAIEAGATWLAVALVEEGLELRDAGLDSRILLLSEVPPGSAEVALRARLTPTVYSDRGLREILDATADGAPAPAIHVKVDTGMHRVGAGEADAVRLAAQAAAAGLEVDGVWTHLARSEELDLATTDEQLDRFDSALRSLSAAGIRPRYRHAANSGGAIAHPRSHLDLVRIGIAMYGISPGPALGGTVDLRPAMTLRSGVSFVKRVGAGEGISYGHRYHPDRDATIATVPIGYADGYRRALSSEGRVIIRGRRHRVAGNVTMDQLLVDCGDHPVERGDEVVLIGRQGRDEIRAEDLAAWAGTIGYEIVTGIAPRVARRHVGA